MAFRAAFSLVELSIVLVILGLLVGAVMTGQSLIRAAQLRQVGKEAENYRIAITTFQEKYREYPGDFRRATDFWGSAGGDGYNATCAAVVSGGKETCNGNGDNSIRDAGTTVSETYRAWQHLANASLIEGSFTGVAGAAGYADATPGVNQPESALAKGGWTLWTFNAGGWSNFQRSGTALWFGSDGSGQAYTLYSILTPEEAWNIDTKFDDGKPAYGKVSTMDNAASYSPNCTTTATAATAEYRVDQKSKLCALIFWLE